MKKLSFVLGSLLLSLNAHGAFGYKITQGPSDLEFKAKAQQLLNEAQARLPVSIKQAFKEPLEVRFESLSSKDKALGLWSYGSLKIDLSTIAEIRRGAEHATPTGRMHKTFYREILATVLHETIHAYDKLNLHDAQERQLIDACREQQDKRKEGLQNPECEFYKNTYRSFSQNPYFDLSAGFVYDDSSWMKNRSPDIYELTNSSESLAVNMEYFLLDPEFACRRPTLYNLLQRKFQHQPFANVSCTPSLNYLMSDFVSNASPVKTLDVSRIYQIHYLLAAEGDGVASGFGHAMFRIVMCAPERTTVGSDCLKDLDYHLVLSFRAFVDTPTINNVKGLKGDYPSRLFLIPFNQAIEEYNKTEMRDLKSIPMNLSRDEIRNFAIRTVETHWSYDGKYYFTSNNCAVESLNLLRTALLRSDLLTIKTITPTGLNFELTHLGLLTQPNFKDRTTAINQGYLFESYRDRYELSFQILKQGLNLPQKNFEEFLALSSQQRSLYYSKLRQVPTGNVAKLAAGILILEKAYQRQEINNIKMELSEKILSQDSETQRSVKKLTGIDALFSQPASFISGASGYGLPLPQDLAAVALRAKQAQNQGTDLYKQVTKQAEGLLSPSHLKNLEISRKNIEYAASFLHSI